MSESISMLTEKQRLEIYDHLRKAHAEIQAIWNKYFIEIEDTFDETAIDAVDSTLYLAEGVFSKTD